MMRSTWKKIQITREDVGASTIIGSVADQMFMTASTRQWLAVANNTFDSEQQMGQNSLADIVKGVRRQNELI